jgi:signal transduction histidine kinase
VRSLTLKLTLAFLAVSLAGIALVAVIVWGFNSLEFNRFITDRGLNDYTNAVTGYYQTHRSWTGVSDYLSQQGLINTNLSQHFPDGGANQNSNPQPPSPFLLVNDQDVVVVAAGPYQINEPVSVAGFQQRVPIKVDNQVVGTILSTGRPPRANPFEQRYLARTNIALLVAALGAVIVSLLLGTILARNITQPVRDLTAATSAMARGQLNQQVRVRSNDEIGELTSTFNKMSSDLEKANQQRRQMTADIAHDLRTPLSVIAGYLEGLKDGVIKPSTQRFTAMHEEALYLQRLVEDLRTLSLADAGELSLNRQSVLPGDILERLVTSFQHKAEQSQVGLTASVEPGLPPLRVDPERMQQVMSNLVSNALRYTQPGGEIRLSAARVEDTVSLEVADSGAGITADALPHVFDRFYRGDDSRQEGGSGLGLAIAKSIVELQGGKITAASQGEGLGSRFTIQFAVESKTS